MKAAFYASDKPREQLLADAFARGMAAHGDTCDILPIPSEPGPATGYEVAVMVGVKSRVIYEANWKAGIHVIMIDKGYLRHRIGGPVRLWEYWRVAIDGHHPTRTLMSVKRSHRRLKRLKLEPRRWANGGNQIVIAGSSAKYHDFYRLPDPTEYATRLIEHITRLTRREIVYRPKPSWRDAVSIKGSTFSGSDQSIADVLIGAHALVTHGSNACFEAMMAGIPSVILGDGVAAPISSTDIREIENPFRATEKARRQWLANLVHCQWTMAEFTEGQAWSVIRPQIYG